MIGAYCLRARQSVVFRRRVFVRAPACSRVGARLFFSLKMSGRKGGGSLAIVFAPASLARRGICREHWRGYGVYASGCSVPIARFSAAGISFWRCVFFAVAVRNPRVLRFVLNVCLRAGILCAVAGNFKRRFPVRARFAAGGCRVFYREFFNAFFGFYIELIAGCL